MSTTTAPVAAVDPDAKSGKRAAAKKQKKKGSLFKSKKFLIVLVLVVVGGGGAYKFLAPAPKPGPPAGGDIVAMDPTTLNLTDGHYLKIGVAVQLVKGKAATADFMPSQAEELVIDEFSNRSVVSLSSNPARQKLTKELQTKIQTAYPEEVFKIFLTQFVTQ